MPVNSSVEQKCLKYLLGARLDGNPPLFMRPDSTVPPISPVYTFKSNFSEIRFDILLPLTPTYPFLLSLGIWYKTSVKTQFIV